MRDLDQPVRNGSARLDTVPGEGGGRVTARDDGTPVVPADRLLDVAGALSEGASRMHARLRHLDPHDRDEILELVSNQVSEIVGLWVDLVRDVVSTGGEPVSGGWKNTVTAPPAAVTQPSSPIPPAGPARGINHEPAGHEPAGHEPADEPSWRTAAAPTQQRWEAPFSPEATGRDVARHEIERTTRDELTGVFNRQAGLSALGREVDRCRRSNERLVLGFLNVDRLKTLNESKGPRAGDEILRKVASALRATLRSYDVVVRLGGDEFLFSLPGADMATAEMRYNEFSVLLGEEAPGTTASVGLAELRERDTLDDLISRADATLVKNRRSLRRTR